MQKIHVTELQ